MSQRVIQFRDKDDLRPLPPIPDELGAAMRQLVDEKINADNLSLFDRLEAIYAYLDRHNAFVSTFSVCQKGCSHCCNIDVRISRLEAEYITLKGGPTLDQGTSVTKGHTKSCPFLGKDGACTVYQFRPFNCRTFHTLDDPKYCATGTVHHQTYGAAGLGYGVPFFAKLAGWLEAIHHDAKLPYRDIRDWFPQGK